MQAALMRSRRFWPLFSTQFLGAFNDNLFKNAVVIMIAFRAVTVAGIPPAQMVALSAAIFIAPYFLFSALAGQLSDKYDKAAVIRATKVAEIVIMGIGALGFLIGSVPLLLLVLFFMGMQSTLFGPCKYSILPQHLQEDELVAGNALIEMGTYLAILLGTLAGGVLIGMEGGERIVAGGVVVVALMGLVTAWAVPPAPSANPGLKVSLDPFFPTWELVRLCRKKQSVWLSILGISWFWCFGSAFLSLFPSYTKDVLGGQESLATLFLALFSVGIGLGSMLCEKLSRERLELGLVPIGSFGMSLFTLDLWLVGQPWPTPAEPIGVMAFLGTFAGARIGVDLALLAVFGGFMIVPMYTLVQWRSDPAETSRIIAGNNVINAVFMVAGALVLAGLFAAGLSTVQIFLALAVVNALVAIYTYTVVPEFMLRFVVWVLSNLVYRVRVQGHSHIPIDGPVVLVCNHVSFVDWFVIAAAIKRPPRFVMHESYYRIPVVSWLFRQARVIPIASIKENPEVLEAAFELIHRELQDEQVVCIFPEGRITDTGEMYPFKQGIERIIKRDPVPVVPVALNGLWGSFFSRRHGPAMTKPFRRTWSRVWVSVGEAVPAAQVTAETVQDRVKELWTRHNAA
jgi:1-acyl-sn-glycerol-3-phosphate acyltransferase